MSTKTLSAGIRKRGRTYYFVVSMGHNPSNYKVNRKYNTFKASDDISEAQADALAEEAYTAFKNKCKGSAAYNPNMKFKDLWALYFDEFAKNKLKEVTYYNYDIVVRTHIMPIYGGYSLKKFNTAMITDFLTSLNCKGSTSRKVKTVLQSIFTYAQRQGIVSINPCVNAIWKKGDEEDNPNYLNVAQAKQLMKLVEDYSVFHTIIKTLLLTGMRSGECLGLRWNCIDFDNNTITIDKTLSYANNRWFLAEPKTKKSTRTISMDPKLAEILLKHKAEQDKAKEICGEAWGHPELVFTSCTGHYYDRSLLNTQFRRFMKKHTEFTYITIHGLRHTNAALLILSHEDIEVISKHLGHSSVDITSRIYSHILSEVNVRVTKTVSSALF